MTRSPALIPPRRLCVGPLLVLSLCLSVRPAQAQATASPLPVATALSAEAGSADDGDTPPPAAKKPQPWRKVASWVVMNAPVGWLAAGVASVSVLGAALMWANSPTAFPGVDRLPFTIPTLLWQAGSLLFVAHALGFALLAITFFVIPELPFVRQWVSESDPPPPPPAS